jgi:hypothetical protein
MSKVQRSAFCVLRSAGIKHASIPISRLRHLMATHRKLIHVPLTTINLAFDVANSINKHKKPDKNTDTEVVEKLIKYIEENS